MLRYFLDFAKQSLRDTLWKNNSGNVCKFAKFTGNNYDRDIFNKVVGLTL